MKKQSISGETVAPESMDKRDLVNIDFYSNEIKVKQQQLQELTEKHRQSKEIYGKVDQLKKNLTAQETNLEKFRKNYQVDQMTDDKRIAPTRTKNEKASGNEGFFQHLKVFENDFKNIRNEVNDFINKWS